MKKTTFLLLLISICFVSERLQAQESTEKEAKNSISISLGHTHVIKGVRDGKNQWLALPSWAIDYNRELNESWYVGLHNEIITEDFEVKSAKEEVIERTFPVSMVAVVGFRPKEYLSFIVGGGAEWAEEETFQVIRLGVEPAFPISDYMELVIGAMYDFKINAYNSWSISFGVARKF
ncbi:hypothetical protein N7E81_12385 [Reichenbachiella carrageenanivorans]|uniref:Outer membrane protein beta-barrel domain-containing protein n=1 Tax=Reichenbachiella carrageenanivorans TaxID=2979869 RepID=A0ABY6CW60_9BACT|nr:hypothetical protein [Reichenbachiella carrageenanivorans]UXX78157.1 hypothetical protein N7E81_12385 [Reichenbachiella carrageenanivorans]